MIFLNTLTGTKDSDGQAKYFRIANQVLITDLELPELENYITSPPEVDVHPPQVSSFSETTGDSLTYRGPGWIGDQYREVECRRHPGGYRIRVQGVGAFTVSNDVNPAIFIQTQRKVKKSLVVEAALGPALILALAMHGTWCLHASAALFNEHLILFTGESGTGKSTLAAHLGKRSGSSWRRVIDDILPVKLEGERLMALPHYPQIKLPGDRQPSLNMPACARIVTIYMIKPQTSGSRAVEIRPLDYPQACLSLVRHTVAACLFDKDLLARHFSFCTQAAQTLAVYELIYPHEFDLLPQVQESLSANLRAGATP